MTKISAKLILASKNAHTGTILYTFELVYPRMILAEWNTHRAFSRNTASTRAIPSKKQRLRILNDPFVPSHIGANRPGMQAGAELRGWRRSGVELVWRTLRYTNVFGCYLMEKLGAHKQIAGRVLEPWMWVQQVASMTDIGNFLKLRNHGAAEPHFGELAKDINLLMWEANYNFDPLNRRALPKNQQVIGTGQWHLPFVTETDKALFSNVEDLKAISAGRCARVSYYLPEEGELALSPERDSKRCEDLAKNGHWSPLEHVATPLESLEYSGNFLAWKQWRKFFPSEDGGDRPSQAAEDGLRTEIVRWKA